MSPTPEQVRAAHDAYRRLREMKEISKYLLDTMAAALPPLPEPEKPGIKSVRELMIAIMTDGEGACTSVDGVTLKWGIEAARAEIVAWLDWEMRTSMGGHYPDGDMGVTCSAFGAVHRLIAALRQADR